MLALQHKALLSCRTCKRSSQAALGTLARCWKASRKQSRLLSQVGSRLHGLLKDCCKSQQVHLDGKLLPIVKGLLDFAGIVEAVQPSLPTPQLSAPKAPEPSPKNPLKAATNVPTQANAAVQEVQKGADQAVEASPGHMPLLLLSIAMSYFAPPPRVDVHSNIIKVVWPCRQKSCCLAVYLYISPLLGVPFANATSFESLRVAQGAFLLSRRLLRAALTAHTRSHANTPQESVPGGDCLLKRQINCAAQAVLTLI